MRALARSLVADRDEAEDLVQDAVVVALEKRSAVRNDLASWLRTVVRNLALRRVGREARRPVIEREAARVESSDSSGEVRGAIERMELQRWLAEALLRLSEPHRSAVILRHVEGLDPGAIAARQGCSREAARQRVARGLSQLRAELDARHGGREAWCLVLAPLAARDAGSAAIPLATGGILMSSKTVLSSLAALAAAALAWLALSPEDDSSARARSPVEAGAVLPVLAEGPRAEPSAPAERSATREETSTFPVAETAEEELPPANPLFAVLSGRVVDGNAAPVAGAEVVVRRPEAGHFSMLDLETRHSPKECARAVTGPAGRFAFELERGIPFDLSVSAAEFCDERLPQRYAGEELEVVLSEGHLVHGFVKRERDGAPIADARVRVFQINRSARNDKATTT